MMPMIAIGTQPIASCQAASDSGGIASLNDLVITVPSPTQSAPASANRIPGSLPRLVSMPPPPISAAIPASATASASARGSDTRSPSTGQATSATHTGIDIPSTAASLARSQISARPMDATQPPIDSVDTKASRNHMPSGTRSVCPRISATRPSATAPTTPHSPRADSGGHSVSRNFMIGKLSPQPIEATTRNARPSGDSGARPATGTAVMDLS
ncbi:hypothetical protein ACVMFB_003211 [Bradyrhizobium sp. USDA 4522]